METIQDQIFSSLKFVMFTRKYGSNLPGETFQISDTDFLEVFPYLQEPKGQYLKISEYPDLYAALGDMWAPPKIRKKFLIFFSVLVNNPAYKKDHFRCPDLRPLKEFS